MPKYSGLTACHFNYVSIEECFFVKRTTDGCKQFSDEQKRPYCILIKCPSPYRQTYAEKYARQISSLCVILHAEKNRHLRAKARLLVPIVGNPGYCDFFFFSRLGGVEGVLRDRARLDTSPPRTFVETCVDELRYNGASPSFCKIT